VETPPSSTESAASADSLGSAGAAVETSPGASADAGHAGKP
jgi:hypothetical protein